MQLTVLQLVLKNKMDKQERCQNPELFMKRRGQSSEFQAESDSGSGVSHQNSQCVKREKIQKLKKKKRRIYSTKSKGNWNLDQDIRFMKFMLQNRQSFENRDLRRTNKIFKKMARFVKTRCPEQCRSHHQKYEKKFLNFDTIVGFISGKAYQASFNQAKLQHIRENQGHINLINDKQNMKRRPYKKRNAQKNKKQKPTVAPVDPTNFSLYREQKDLYNILIAYQPKFELKIMFDFERVEQYEFGK